MANKAPQYTVRELADMLTQYCLGPSTTIEGELLKKKFIRELYKQIGEPTKAEFPSEFKYAGYYKKVDGYTTGMAYLTKERMNAENRKPTIWCINRPSQTKINIERSYSRDGWSCTVQAYNVICVKYVKHPRYDNIWVRFRNTRDCATYEYIIEDRMHE